MNKLLFFITFIIHTSIHAMLFDYPKLSPEMQCKVLDWATVSGKNSKEAAFMINALYVTNQALNTEINKPRYADNLIKKLATKYYCSHETIAKRLLIRSVKERLALQYQLKTLCCCPHGDIAPHLYKQLDKLISKGVDLEFTYNHDHQQKTPLMLAITYNGNMITPLIKSGANINGRNSCGMTALHFACKKGRVSYVKKLLAYPQLALNQRNNHDENALLYCLIHRHQFAKRFFPLYEMLIKAGLDPECTNKKGLTPLYILKTINKLPDAHRALYLLHSAIEQKHDPIDQNQNKVLIL